ncbi:MAG: (d)CMP kinase, partial [Schleiferiaceae bacterium]|nr:(d)CMP kinase [Schleiferiaceae bacterium]
MTKHKLTIAIDGYSSTGKSTMAKALAKELEYSYVDTGAMYRAVTLYAVECGFFEGRTLIHPTRLIAALPQLTISFHYNNELGKSVILMNGKDVENAIRDMAISNKVSTVATLPEVRQAMVALQQKMGESGGIVMDGRDIGTVVFPDADLKIFMTADPKIRAQRRLDELVAKGERVSFDEVLENLQLRDHMDSTRKE